MRTTHLHHIAVTVSNPLRSQAFYRDVLGFEITTYEGDSFSFQVGESVLFFHTHDSTKKGERFDETRIGLDHLSFVAPDREALEKLVKTLRDADVETTDVKIFPPSGNLYVVFRDPDNIQLEYWLVRS